MHHQRDPGGDTADYGALRGKYDVYLEHIGSTPADSGPGEGAVAGDIVLLAGLSGGGRRVARRGNF